MCEFSFSKTLKKHENLLSEIDETKFKFPSRNEENRCEFNIKSNTSPKGKEFFQGIAEGKDGEKMIKKLNQFGHSKLKD